MRSNLSSKNALFRLAFGIALLLFGLSKTNKNSLLYLCFILVGSLKTAEGLLRYCPLKDYQMKHHVHTHQQPDDVINPS
ncbi:hypothetical protein JCM19046_1834 [Bacillus sp. JCM 19046]|uniref:Inner membrane protein YgaP-like transmembrane domain-containing protein n=1 Tax=Shouchella xiaoxiensis TaxID=766895 RepID=A0ABS2SUT1_9BACI|nr:DUF2892 domain-containing protein [Shouchella xiaoxiensis]MBM7839000.1 hypothetical protein [Shouchella xiaoxiensis]GAF13541.1 hypothetical protein JCM19045_2790 [Bacillus sp. JCM 19045]GAF17328.1 hypothetical protein JCM19046_1834 [Bacillus sp. JCM 19046]